MRKIIVVLLLGIFTGTSIATETSVVPFRLEKGFLIVFDCAASLLEKLSCVLDTGASRTVVEEDVANRLHLDRTADEIFVTGRTSRVSRVRLEQLAFGKISVRSLQVLVVDLDGMSKTLGINIDVVVGLDVLSRHAVTIDYRKHVLVFDDDVVTGKVVSLDPDSPYPLLPVMIGGQIVRLLVDTGADAISLFEGHVPTSPQLASQMEASGSNAVGVVRAKALRAIDIQVGERKFSRQTIFIVPCETGFTAYDGHFGIRSVEVSSFHFDFAHRQISWRK